MFWVTAGKGMEYFSKIELQEKLNVGANSLNDKYEGKIIFDLQEHLQNIPDPHEQHKRIHEITNELKTIERLFGVVQIVPKLEDFNRHKSRNSTGKQFLSNLFNAIKNYTETEANNLRWAEYATNHTDTDWNNDDSQELLHNEAKRTRQSTKFRISVKISRNMEQNLNVTLQSISKCLGSAMAKRMTFHGWEISLRKPQIEIVANVLNDTTVLIGIPLSSKPISERSYLKHIPLRSTVAYAMAYSVFFQMPYKDNLPGGDENKYCIIDPMCGAATILIELVKNFKTKVGYVLGMDNNETQLQKATENLEAAGVISTINLIKGDIFTVRGLVGYNKFTHLVCDIPFGLKFGSMESAQKNLPAIVDAFDALLDKDNGCMCLLVSSKLKETLKEELKLRKFEEIQEHSIRLGSLESVIIITRR